MKEEEVAAIRATMTASETLGVKRFMELQQTLFPDGEISDIGDVQRRIVDGTATFADAFVAKMYDLGVGKNDLLEQLPETQEFAKKFHKAFSVKVTEKAMNMVSYADQVRGINKYYDFDQNFFEANQLINEGRSNLSSNVISKTISPLNRSIENVRLNKLTSAKAKPGSRKLFAGNIPPEVLQTVVKQIDVIRKAEGDVAADAVLASLLGMRGDDLTETRTTVELATRFKPQRPVYDIETGTIVNPVEEGEPGKGLKPIGDDRPLGPLMRRVYDERYNKAGPTGEIFPDMTTAKINRVINKYIYPALPAETRKAAKKKHLDYTDMRRITATAIANGMGNVEAADAIISHKGSDKELDAKILRAYYIDVEDVDKLSKRGVIFSMFEKMMADSLGATTGGQFAAALGYDFPDFEADYSSLDSKGTVDAPEQAQEIDQRPVAEQATPEQQAENQAIRENRSRLTSAEMEREALSLEEENYQRKVDLEQRRLADIEAGVMPAPGTSPIDAAPEPEVRPGIPENFDVSDFTPEEIAELEGIGVEFSAEEKASAESRSGRNRARTVKRTGDVLKGAAAAKFLTTSTKAMGAVLPGPDPFELAAGVLDQQLSPPGESAADIAVRKGQKFAGDLLGVEAKRAESMSDIFTKETLAQTAGGIGGVVADIATLGTVSGTGPFAGERTGNISGRNLRAQQLRERQNAEEGFVKRPGLGIPKP